MKKKMYLCSHKMFKVADDHWGDYNFTLTKSEENVWALTVVNNDTPTGITDVNVTEAKNGKYIQNNRVVIVKNGKAYTPAGTSVK